MKQIKYFFVGLFLLAINSVTAQETEVKWGPLEGKSGLLSELLPFQGADFYSLRWKGGNVLGGYYLTKHLDFKMVQTEKVVKSVNNSIVNFQMAAIIDDHASFFLSDRKEGKELLYLQQYGYDLKPRGEAKLVAEIELAKGQTNTGYDIIQSKDKKYFAVFWLIEEKKVDKDSYGYCVYNDKLEKVNEGKYEIPFAADYSEVSTHLLTNSGDYFIAIKEFEPSPEKKVFRNYLQYKAMHIFQVEPDQLHDYTMDMRGNRVEAISINTDEAQHFIITGVYGQNQVEGVKGLFFLKLDYKNQLVLDQGFEEFEKDFITESWTERELERAERREEKGKGAPSLYDYKMRDIHILPDGSIVGSIEQNYVMARSFSDTRGVISTTYTYYYNDIIAFKIGTKGGFEWLQKIKKLQVSTNDGGPFSSYSSFIADNKLKFIFNDSRANYDENGNYVQGLAYLSKFTKRDNVVSYTEVDLSNGIASRRSLFSRKEIGTLALPKMFVTDFKRNEMLLYTTFKGKERYGLLNFGPTK